MIKIVMSERNKLRIAGSELIELITPLVYNDEKNAKTEDLVLIQKKVLEVSEALANIAGFCDDHGKDLVNYFKINVLGINMLRYPSYRILLISLPTIIGIDVDYTKMPFKVMGLSAEALGAKIKAIAKR